MKWNYGRVNWNYGRVHRWTSLAALMLIVLLSACTRKVVVAKPRPTFDRTTWAAQLQDASRDCPKGKCETYLVFITKGSKPDAPMSELCPKHAYVCTAPDFAGNVVQITRWRR